MFGWGVGLCMRSEWQASGYKQQQGQKIPR